MPAADVILENGKVITLDRESQIAEAVVIRGQKILSVGSREQVIKEAGSNTRHIDLKGRTVVPGFFDGHPHMDREGLKALGGATLEGRRSIAEIVDAVADAVKMKRPGEWVVMMPLGDPPAEYMRDPSAIAERRFPTRHDLDPVSPNNPVYIRSIWGWWGTPPFPSVANTYALHKARITRDTPAPYRSTIEKDANGDPTGIFYELNRAPLLEYTLFGKLPRFSYSDRVDGIRSAAKTYSSLGTTTGFEGHGLTPSVIRAYREVQESGDLTVRMHAPLSVPSASKSDAEIIELFYYWGAVASGRGSGDEQLRITGVNLDLGDPSLAMVLGSGYPYEQWAGFFYQGLSDERFIELGVAAVRAGLRISTLFCYDLERAIRLFEVIDRQQSIRDLRCVAVHLSQGTDQQLSRIRRLGMAATMAPVILYEHAETFGIENLNERALPAREILDAGIPVTLSTDNLPRPSMLWQMWEILARYNKSSRKNQGQSKLTRDEALRMAVQNGHYLTWEEGERGSVEAGKYADLVVLDQDPLACELDKLKDIKVILTIVNGRIVYEHTSPTLRST
jgi:predicted amidohydrolase YtcJ